MTFFVGNVLYNFLIAFGVVIGASVFSGLGAVINNHPPLKTMISVARSIKIWAVVVSLGGTIASFELIDQGILKGEIKPVIKQLSYILIAFIGANLGYSLIKLLEKCGKLWME